MARIVRGSPAAAGVSAVLLRALTDQTAATNRTWPGLRHRGAAAAHHRAEGPWNPAVWPEWRRLLPYVLAVADLP